MCAAGKNKPNQGSDCISRGILGCWHSSSSITDNEKVFSCSHTSENKWGWDLLSVRVLYIKIMTITKPLWQGLTCGLQEWCETLRSAWNRCSVPPATGISPELCKRTVLAEFLFIPNANCVMGMQVQLQKVKNVSPEINFMFQSMMATLWFETNV